MNGSTQLEVVYDWRERRLEQRLLAPGEALTFGTGPTATFVAPEGQADHLGRDPWPGSMQLLKPRRGGYRLRLLPAMTGILKLRGKQVDIGSLFDVPAPRRLLRKPAVHRDVELASGDSADIVIDAVNQLRISVAFVEAPEKLSRPRRIEPLFFKAAFWSVNTILATLIVVLFVGSRIPPFTPQLDITPERLAKLVPPPSDQVKAREDESAKLAAEEARRKKMEREAAEARRAKLAEGKLGHPDANRKETVMPKGREDVLREKVSKVGILSALGRAKAPGSSLSNLLSNETSDVEQAVTGLQGAKLAMGKGNGLANAGTGLGGGGTTFGKIGGTGNLDLGTSRNRGRRGPNLGSGHEKQVSAGVETGSPDAEGGLSKDQVMRVVRSHAAAIKYCFDKEFQRNPHLNGRIDLFWVIHPNGSVDRIKVAKSAMNNDAVEGCMLRTVKGWQFPKADADTIVQSFPFFFKGTGG
jgi:hypothetical protein